LILAAKSGAGSGHQARRTGMSASEIFSLKQSTYETADGLCIIKIPDENRDDHGPTAELLGKNLTVFK
jgi:hypothetical protein